MPQGVKVFRGSVYYKSPKQNTHLKTPGKEILWVFHGVWELLLEFWGLNKSGGSGIRGECLLEEI